MATDPLDVLRSPDPEVTPDPAFVAGLRRRLATRTAADSATADAPDGLERPTVVAIADAADRRRRRSRQHLVGLVAGAAAAAGLLAALLVVRDDDGDELDVVDTTITTGGSASTTSTPPSATPPTSSPTTTAGTGLPPPQGIGASGGASLADSLAVSVDAGPGALAGYRFAAGRGTVDVFDPASGATRSNTDLPIGVVDINPVVAAGSLWLASSGQLVGAAGSSAVLRVDLASGAVVGRLDVPGGLRGGWATVADERGVWYLSRAVPSRLVHVDAATTTVDREVPIAGSPTALGWGADSLWAAGTDGALYRFDATSGTETARVAIPDLAEAYRIELIGNDAWVFGRSTGSRLVLARVDTTSGRVAPLVTVGERVILTRAYDLAVGGGRIWVTAVEGLVAVDIASGSVTARYAEGAGATSVAADDEAVWFVGSGKLYRLPLG